MATFPRTEAEIVVLANSMIAGLTDNTAVYPSPPILPAELSTKMSAYLAAKNAAIAAAAAYDAAITAKDEALEDMVDDMKTDIAYVENTAKNDSDKLKLIGWNSRKSRTALTQPGQSRLLEAPRQGDGWVFLDWKAPSDGGKPSAYKVMRRERPEGTWADVATAIDSEATLVEQPKGKELEYRIVAVNKAGEGEASNTQMVVL
ncbi:MAG: fibronectin type III domain-containing protein [Phycisphaerae bacterium]|nr:fibronectin type III domain-containing protein [Phycisphaerae bacterium]